MLPLVTQQFQWCTFTQILHLYSTTFINNKQGVTGRTANRWSQLVTGRSHLLLIFPFTLLFFNLFFLRTNNFRKCSSSHFKIRHFLSRSRQKTSDLIPCSWISHAYSDLSSLKGLLKIRGTAGSLLSRRAVNASLMRWRNTATCWWIAVGSRRMNRCVLVVCLLYKTPDGH